MTGRWWSKNLPPKHTGYVPTNGPAVAAVTPPAAPQGHGGGSPKITGRCIVCLGWFNLTSRTGDVRTHGTDRGNLCPGSDRPPVIEL